MENQTSKVVHETGYIQSDNIYFGKTKTDKPMASFNISCYNKDIIRVSLFDGQAAKFKDIQEELKNKKVCITGLEPQVTEVTKNGKTYKNKSMIAFSLYVEVISHKDKTEYGQEPQEDNTPDFGQEEAINDMSFLEQPEVFDENNPNPDDIPFN